jgi:hypothetical protein
MSKCRGDLLRIPAQDQGGGAITSARPPPTRDRSTASEQTTAEAGESNVQPVDEAGPAEKKEVEKRDIGMELTTRQRARMADLSLLLDVVLNVSTTTCALVAPPFLQGGALPGPFGGAEAATAEYVLRESSGFGSMAAWQASALMTAPPVVPIFKYFAPVLGRRVFPPPKQPSNQIGGNMELAD